MTKLEAAKLPSGWALTTIGDVVEPKVSQDGPSRGHDFTYVDISSVSNTTKRIAAPKTLPRLEAPSRARQNLKAGDVLVSMTRPNLNAVALVPQALEGSVGSTGFDVLRTRAVNPRWLYCFVQTSGFIHAMSSKVLGALYPAVRPKDIRDYPLPLAPLPEQRRIVEAIESNFARLDEAKSSLTRAKTNLKAYRATVLKTAFEGQLVPQDPRDVPASQLLERNWQGSHEGHHGTERGAGEVMSGTVPHDTTPYPLSGRWEWERLGVVAEVITEGTDPRKSPTMLHIAPDNIESSTGRLLPCRTVKEDQVVSNNFRFTKGDVLYTKLRPYLNKVVVAPFDGLCSSDVLPIRARIDTSYLRYWMLSPRFLSQVIPRQTGVTLPRVSRKSLTETFVPVAPLPEQRRIVTEVERLLSFADEVDRMINVEQERAASIRQSVLKSAFEGQLVPQDPSDEPASVLLERIKRERSSPSQSMTRNRKTPRAT